MAVRPLGLNTRRISPSALGRSGKNCSLADIEPRRMFQPAPQEERRESTGNRAEPRLMAVPWLSRYPNGCDDASLRPDAHGRKPCNCSRSSGDVEDRFAWSKIGLIEQ